jgi:predicted  nucleic acid-binding Zn-ribbon protein
MTKAREDYVAQLKIQLDRWNDDMDKWEGQAKAAHADMKKRYEKQLEAVRARREEARYQLKLVEGASATAWTELARGADEAWSRMREAATAARTHFEKNP